MAYGGVQHRADLTGARRTVVRAHPARARRCSAACPNRAADTEERNSLWLVPVSTADLLPGGLGAVFSARSRRRATVASPSGMCPAATRRPPCRRRCRAAPPRPHSAGGPVPGVRRRFRVRLDGDCLRRPRLPRRAARRPVTTLASCPGRPPKLRFETGAAIGQGEVRTYRVDANARQLVRRDEATGARFPFSTTSRR